jgi:hypothetical protein
MEIRTVCIHIRKGQYWGGVLKLWDVEISAAGLCCSCCRVIIINRCVYSRLINVVVSYCLLITGRDFDFLYNVKECDPVYSGILVSTFRWNLLYSFTSSVQKIYTWHLLVNRLKPCRSYMYRTVVTICTTRFNFYKFYVLPTQCICVFCVDLRTNSDYFPIQH